MTGATRGRDGFVTYDELAGPGLDGARRTPARLPLPGGPHVPVDPTRSSPSPAASSA